MTRLEFVKDEKGIHISIQGKFVEILGGLHAIISEIAERTNRKPSDIAKLIFDGTRVIEEKRACRKAEELLKNLFKK